MLATLARGQDSQFVFDANGNLLVQTAETSAPPQILGQPQNQIVEPGAAASFFVVAADTRALTYRWRFNGADIGGATNDAVLLQNVSTNNEGQYSVVLTNPSGSVTSAPAMLWIDSRGCGMADSWQLFYFGNLTNTAAGDSDGDGVSNLQEFLDGTNPTNSASVLYRITLFSAGGSVVKVPDQATYTNGQSVTLTATASSNEPFHAWTGDVLTRSNSISLVMTNNKTVFAHFAPMLFMWTNRAGGDWNIATNWTPNLAPGTNDSVFIGDMSGTVTLNTPADCANVTLGGPNGSPIIPTLTGTGTLTVRDSFLWLSGRMSGSGAIVIEAGATLDIANDDNVVLDSRPLDNRGTVLWEGTGILVLNNSAVTNRTGALFHAQNAATIGFGFGTPRFDNAGTFRKSNGTTTIASGLAFNNSGTVEIQTGSLSLLGGGNHSGGFAVAGGSALILSGTHTAEANSTFTGAGGLTVSGGTADLAGLVNVSGSNTFSSGTVNLTGNYVCTNNTLTISGGTANFNGIGLVSPAVVNLTSGTLSGSNPVTVGSAMTWTAGTMSGSGRTIIQTGATLNAAIPSLAATLNNRTLENGGTVLWTGAGVIQMITAAITNRVGALFHAQNSATFQASGVNRFDNAGTFRKSVSTGTTTIASGVSFNNSGTVEIQTGTLSLSGGGTNSGSLTVAAGSALNLSGGTHNAGGSSSITGAGQFTVSGGTANLAGLVNVSGSNTFSAGFANLTGNYLCTNNTLTISGSSANFSGTGMISPAVVILSGGTLDGSNGVTVGSLMNWTGGTMSGSGRTIITPGATLNLSGASSVFLSRPLENGGTVLWTGAGGIGMGVITNRAGALFDVRNAAAFSVFGASPRFDNAGTFRKSVHPGTATFPVSFNNYGTVDIRSGILAANGGYASSSNALLNCALGGTTAGTNYGQLQVAGTVTLNGGLSVDLLPGFMPATNDTFTVLTAGTRSGTFASFSYPSNRVTLSLSNSPTSVVLRATDVFPIPRPVLLTPQLVGSNALLTWTATANVTYRLENNGDAGSTNWTAVPGDVTTFSNTASKLDALTPSNRLYRVRVVP